MGRRAGGPAAPTESPGRAWAAGRGGLRGVGLGGVWGLVGETVLEKQQGLCKQVPPAASHPPTQWHPPLSACPVLTKEGPRLDSTVRSCCARSGDLASKLPDAKSASTRVMKPPSLAAT